MHFIERPPLIYRWLFGNALWRMPGSRRKCVYLTFDDGPVPGITPWVLELLRDHGIHATFFMVGENVMRNPELLDQVKAGGHAVGNHTLSHMQGIKSSTSSYLANVERGGELTGSRLFRPPHGLMTLAQTRAVKRSNRLVMYDLVTRDYSRNLSPDDVVRNVRRFTRNGSIIVFHDSLKAWPNLRRALPRAIKWLKAQGYEFRIIQ